MIEKKSNYRSLALGAWLRFEGFRLIRNRHLKNSTHYVPTSTPAFFRHLFSALFSILRKALRKNLFDFAVNTRIIP